MDGRGGCCIARYAGNTYDMSKMDRIMLRYRPIAPKPATNSSCSGSSTAENSGAYVKTGRAKRRYVRNSGKKKIASCSNGGVTKKCRCARKRKSPSPEENESMNGGRSTVSTGSVSGGDGVGVGVVTLPLLPETPETNQRSSSSSQERPARGASSRGVEKAKVPMWLNFEGGGSSQRDGKAGGMVGQPVRVVGTWVRVECVTETWAGVGLDDVYGGGLGCTDQEKVMNLDRDTCPGFVTEGLSRVVWVNRAYRAMVVGQEEAESSEEEVVVWLVMKEGFELPPKNWPAFTCRVRVVTCGKGNSSLTLPCDVWRLGGGHGFAWRLDTKAALSLGR
ncbi:uncharacterized protein [Coffea arabica]|uniref:DUF7950 domain-containing protein n=1 Tax=Coffea arabica TaxID=13443 RepID=A0ABM4U409_COFAR|nr:uncharacterized protein LOC113739403 [Coffea arabica]